MSLSEPVALAAIILVTLGPSLVIAPLTAPGSWYQNLQKPSWTPPGWLFGPVWVALYLSMSVAMWLVWKQAPDHCSLPLGLYATQLILNHAWSPAFFGLKRPAEAFGVISLLWLAIAATTVCFYLRVPAAAQLMLPYLAWVSFAAALNYRIWRDNPTP